MSRQRTLNPVASSMRSSVEHSELPRMHHQAPAASHVELRGPADTAAGAASSWHLGQLRRVLRTASYIPPRQLAARARFMALRRVYALAPSRPIVKARREAQASLAAEPLPALPFELLAPEGAGAIAQRAAELAQGRFVYLGKAADFSAGIRWHDPDASPLWAFNLQYLGAVLDLTLAGRSDDARRLLASWCGTFQEVWDPVTWHPYPVSLRLRNICLAAGHAGRFEALGTCIRELAATHAAYLLRHMERDLRGNHLLENAFALLVAARCLRGPLASRCEAAARNVLTVEVGEQILADGGHFELSPMYHAILLHRLLQATVLLGSEDPLVRHTLAPALQRMARFLCGILCPDGDIPLLGDSVRGAAPPPRALLELARQWAGAVPAEPAQGITSFNDSGLHVFRGSRLWAILDAGPVCPAYVPGHGQADSLTVEVWCDGVCVVGDPGVHEYTGAERAWNRSTRAHSAMTLDDADTSEVYGSFRVGGRAQVRSVIVQARTAEVTLEPYGTRARFTRRVRLGDPAHGVLEINDAAAAPVGGTVRSRLHLHPAVMIAGGPSTDGRRVVLQTPRGWLRITAQHALYLESGRASRRFGMIEPTTIIVQELQPSGAAAEGRLTGTFLIEPLETLASARRGHPAA